MRQGPNTRISVGPTFGSQASYFDTVAGFTARTGLTPTLLFPLQEASGNVVDKVSGSTLVAGSTIRYRYPTGGVTGIQYNHSIANHSADFGDVGTNSFIVGGIATHPVVFPATNPGVTGRTSYTGFPCYYLYRASDTTNYGCFVVRDATTQYLLPAPATDVVTHKKPVLYLGAIDKITNLIRFCLATTDSILFNGTGSCAGILTLSGGTTPKYFVGASAATSGGPAVSYSFLCQGAQCEGLNLATLAKRMGFGGN